VRIFYRHPVLVQGRKARAAVSLAGPGKRYPRYEVGSSSFMQYLFRGKALFATATRGNRRAEVVILLLPFDHEIGCISVRLAAKLENANSAGNLFRGPLVRSNTLPSASSSSTDIIASE